MATLEYKITGNNKAFLAAIDKSIAAVSKLQGSIDNLNKTNLGGIADGFNKATQAAAGFAKAAEKGSQAFKDEQVAAALTRLDAKLLVTNGNLQLFGGSIKNTQQTLGAYQSALNSLLSNGTGPTDKRIVTFKGHIDELTKSIQFQKEAAKVASSGKNSSFLGALGSGVGGAISSLQSLATGYLGLFAVVAGTKKVIDSNAEISDSLADIRRTAGLTQPEVENLFVSLKKIDTRTSLKGLADIAIIGGQLGIAKDQLGGFTKAVDQLSVSLAGELKGGPEEVAQSLGILDKVFGVSAKNGGDVEKSFNKIGSVILGLGQSGLATGDFLTDFAKRVGGVAAQAKLGLPTLLSYGAVLQEQGVTAEVAGTAFKKLLGSLATKREAFLPIAQIADSTLTLKSFTDLINNDTQKALSLFFEGLAKGGSTTTAFADLLKSVGLDASRSGQAITALARNQASLTDHIKESNEQFAAGTLAADQFLVKNDTLGASVDKLGKSFVSLTTTGGVSSFFKSIIDGLTNTLNAFSTLTNSESWGEFFTRLSHPFGQDTKKGIDLEFAIPKAIKQSSSVATDFNKTFNPTGASDELVGSLLKDKSAAQLKQLVDKYGAAAKQAVGALNDYRKGIAQGLIKDGGEFSVADAEKNFQKLQGILNIVSHAYRDVKGQSEVAASAQVKAAGEVADADLKTVKAIHERIAALKDDALANPDNAAADIKRIDALEARLDQFKHKVGGRTNNGTVFDAISASLTDIFNKTNGLANESGLTGYKLKVQEITDRYIKLNAEIDANQTKLNTATRGRNLSPSNQKKATADQDLINKDRIAVTKARAKELSDAQIEEATRVSNEIQRINAEFGVKTSQSRAKELAEIQARYDAEVVKAQGNVDILNALNTGRLAAIQAVNDKYLQLEQDLHDKINLINEQAAADISGKEESQTQRIENEWKKRISAADKYYDELIRINSTNVSSGDDPLGFQKAVKDLQLKKDQADTQLTGQSASDAAVNRKILEPFANALSSSVKQFGNDFVSTLTNVDTYAKGTFTSIFADLTQKLTTSLNGFFTTTFTTLLSKALNSALSSSSSGLFNKTGGLTGLGAGIAAAGIAGGIVSAASPKTSTLGQGLGGALSGAATGAAIGSIIPGVGTAVGAVAGGLIGAISGIFGSASARKKQEELQKQQLEEAKKQTALQKAQYDAYTSQIIGRQTANGVISGVSIGATGQLVATVSGKDLQFVLDRSGKSR